MRLIVIGLIGLIGCIVAIAIWPMLEANGMSLFQSLNSSNKLQIIPEIYDVGTLNEGDRAKINYKIILPS